MTDQGDHIVLKCSGNDCGMRYPSPADDPRRHACPLCESPVTEVGRYHEPPIPTAPTLRPDNSMLVGVLDNIRSAQNVGTMLRSADGVALDHVYLGGLTAAADNPKVVKTALGAEATVASTSMKDTIDCVNTLRDQGFEIWAIDYTARSTALQAVGTRPAKLAFVVGNERAGVDPLILEMAERHIHLDMYGEKTTLNVGVTFGAVAYALRTIDAENGSTQGEG